MNYEFIRSSAIEKEGRKREPGLVPSPCSLRMSIEAECTVRAILGLEDGNIVLYRGLFSNSTTNPNKKRKP